MRLGSRFTALFGVLAAGVAVLLILVFDETLRRAVEDRVVERVERERDHLAGEVPGFEGRARGAGRLSAARGRRAWMPRDARGRRRKGDPRHGRAAGRRGGPGKPREPSRDPRGEGERNGIIRARHDDLRSRVAREGRPFGARRVSAKPEIDRRDSPPRVRHARSVASGLAMPVHAAIAGVGIGHYSRRQRQGKSEERFPAARSGRRRWATRERSQAGLKTRLYVHYSYGVGAGASPSRHAALFVLGTVSPVPPQQ